jgi:hypothetical protein
MIKSLFIIGMITTAYFIGAGVIDTKNSLHAINVTLDSTIEILEESNAMLKDMTAE